VSTRADEQNNEHNKQNEPLIRLYPSQIHRQYFACLGFAQEKKRAMEEKDLGMSKLGALLDGKTEP
jgi:hypothetical protein